MNHPPSPLAPAAPAPQRAVGGAGNNAAADQVQQNLPSLDRMIIRTVTMTIAVGNVQEAFRQVVFQPAQDAGGPGHARATRPGIGWATGATPPV